MFGVGRAGVEQRALLNFAVDDFLLRRSEPGQRALLRLERLEIEIFIGPFEADHEHDGLPGWYGAIKRQKVSSVLL